MWYRVFAFALPGELLAMSGSGGTLVARERRENLGTDSDALLKRFQGAGVAVILGIDNVCTLQSSLQPCY